MTPALLALLLAAGDTAVADPCAPLSAAAADATAAAEYRAVAESELARGAHDTAVIAFRAAAARDPGDSTSRAALARLCARPRDRDDPFAEGVARLEAGDPRGALRAFRAVHGPAAPPPAVALLEGICQHDLGEDAQAERLLRAAESSPAHREAARLYLGLLRLRAGETGEAAELFDAAAGRPALAGIARDMGRVARRDGRLVLSVLAETAWDSNVTLAPEGADPAPEDDGAAGLTAELVWRPRGRSGPYLRAGGGLTEHLTLGEYDFAAVEGAAGWQLRLPSLALAAEYGYGVRRLGGAPYLSAQRLLASAVLSRGRTALSATYAARFEDYARAYRDYSGIVHRAELRLSLPLGGAARVALAYGGARDLADAAALSFVEHGPRAELLLVPGARWRLGLEAGASFREYGEADPVLGAVRRDEVLDATAFGEVDLGAHLTARLSLLARRARSSVDAFDHDRLVPVLGLLWVLSG
jgi:tetratricopeptide (TPR) repeat protein